jgi:hypothetical protein
MVGIVNVVGNFGVAIVCAEILSGVSAVLFARDEGVLSTSGAARAVGVDKSRITGEGVVMMLSGGSCGNGPDWEGAPALPSEQRL